MFPTGKVYWSPTPNNTRGPQVHTKQPTGTNASRQALHATRTPRVSTGTHARRAARTTHTCMERTQISAPNDPTATRVHISIYDYQLEWMNEHNIQRSGFVRDLLDDVLVDARTDLADDQTTLTEYTNTDTTQ